MNFDYLPSLEHMALHKVALTLWNKHPLPNDGFVLNLEHMWHSLENEIREIIDNLPLTILTRKRLMKFYKRIHFEIAVWMVFIRDYVPKKYDSICIRDIIWTSLGTIDKKKTAEILVKNENLPITVRYELACIYCIQDDIQLIYELLPVDNNYEHFVSNDLENELFGEDNFYQHNKLIVAWTHAMRQGQMNFFYLYPHAVIHGNKVAAEFLFIGTNVILTLHVIDAIFYGDFWQRVYFFEVLSFLLEQMDADELTELLHSKEVNVLIVVLFCLKHWPWNICFKDTHGCTCDVYCNESNILKILNLFYKPRKENYDPNIFRGSLFVFRNTFPEKFSSIIKHCDHENLLVHIFKANDIRSLELALKYLPEIKKINFFRKWCNIFCKYMADKRDFNMLEAIHREFADSKYMIMKYETKVEKLQKHLL